MTRTINSLLVAHRITRVIYGILVVLIGAGLGLPTGVYWGPDLHGPWATTGVVAGAILGLALAFVSWRYWPVHLVLLLAALAAVVAAVWWIAAQLRDMYRPFMGEEGIVFWIGLACLCYCLLIGVLTISAGVVGVVLTKTTAMLARERSGGGFPVELAKPGE